jgi:hypothetical protein
MKPLSAALLGLVAGLPAGVSMATHPVRNTAARAIADRIREEMFHVTGPRREGMALAERIARSFECPTCSPPTRATVGMVCQTCRADYSR